MEHMKVNTLSILLLIGIFIFGCNSQSDIHSFKVSGVNDPVISLNGTWKFSMDPPAEFWDNDAGFQEWADIQVPGECQMQGFAIKHDRPYAYKHRFTIPEDYKGQQIFLNFYGVYSYARVWVNGEFVRDHFGGFTKWSCDITKFVSAGEPAVLTVEITDRKDDISYGSGYAKHQIGGILRDVELVALPGQNFRKLHFETDLDEAYRDAELKVSYELNQNTAASIRVELFDSDNKRIELFETEVSSPAGNLVIPVENPEKWDAEHPNLYKVVTTLVENGIEILQIPEKIGFREVHVQGNRLLVNGKPVKLRGACRHDIHPLLGRLTIPEYDKKDVLLAKECNMNFIRTSHYPPSETFLDFCDEYGIYVEDETAVCFVGSHRTQAYRGSGASQNDPGFTHRYLSQLEEMVQNHRNHPSVIMWSIGNENTFGENFVESFKWVKENDPTRPVIYSYPGQVPDSLQLYDILSMHYPGWRGNLQQYGITTMGFNHDAMPVLFDEWAHVACYNNFELKEDPNVRNFWGQSLDSMWTALFEAEGGLGGAIWCMLDETFMLPEDLPGFNDWWGILDPNVIPATYTGPCVGYGEWGIADTWRRKKPEFWSTKKAYSPTKVMLKQIDQYEPDKQLSIPVHNRYDHTNFSELKITWAYGDHSADLANIDLQPHVKGELVIPPNPWNPEEELNIKFYQKDTFLVDEYNIRIGKREVQLPVCEKGFLSARETEDRFIVSGEQILFNVNKNSGLIENVRLNNETIIESGPYLNLKFPGEAIQYSTIRMQDHAENWQCTACEFELNDGVASIYTEGVYGDISVTFVMEADEKGVFKIDYMITGAPEGKNIQEAGIKFNTGNAFATVSWDRESYFTAYPENHLGDSKGEADLNEKPPMKYREQPGHDWEMDTRGFYYFGLEPVLAYSNIARSLKENIYLFGLTTGRNARIEVCSDGTQACRFDEIEGKNTLIINEQWDYNSLGWGNYMKRIESSGQMEGQCVFRIAFAEPGLRDDLKSVEEI
jgi:hypothetical protein